MQPDDDKKPHVPTWRASESTATPEDAGRDTVASLARDQIDKIYEHNPPNQPEQQQTVATDPYERTHDSAKSAATWEDYHSAWQNYYQQYYLRYYLAQLHNAGGARGKAAAQAISEPVDPRTQAVFSDRQPSQSREAVTAIQQELRTKISKRANKIRSSNHFWPIISAITVGLLFLGLQYEQLIQGQILSYISPGSGDTSSIILDPNANTKVSSEPRLIIPKINVDIPVIYSNTTDDATVEAQLQNGVVHYPIPGANAVPGQIGNGVILGHSTNSVFDTGSYKFAFLFLNRLTKGDTFYINYQGTRYTYVVTGSRVVNPNQIGELIVTTDKPLMTLVTCTPIGTSLQRLLVSAEQISPDPSKAAAAQPGSGTSKPANIPGNSPTILEQLIGAQ